MAVPKKSVPQKAKAISDVTYPWGPRIIQIADPAYLKLIDPAVLKEIKTLQIDHEIEMADLEKKTLLKMKAAINKK